MAEDGGGGGGGGGAGEIFKCQKNFATPHSQSSKKTAIPPTSIKKKNSNSPPPPPTPMTGKRRLKQMTEKVTRNMTGKNISTLFLKQKG